MLCAASASAQLYKSVGTDGRITYSDTPPASAARIEQKTLSLSPKSKLPGELAQVVKAHPVTLYTTSSMQALRGRPQPADRTRNSVCRKNRAEQRRPRRAAPVGGDRQLPLLTIGNRQLQGLETDIWQEALTAAGYPIAGKLPKPINIRRRSLPPGRSRKPRRSPPARRPSRQHRRRSQVRGFAFKRNVSHLP